ncbi:hypothetical protein C8034_v011201 [Colletotrichum sidae]|uniref:Ecp2 effector protein-like domain-containing protein n=1 Tax=Colletotrichum sidae TaxID=1347389 RepID=A0A4R8THZ7_9PEZI|nr:hypothetical protein C8034_v011201 [Colletotrichum sidae]
MAAVAGVLAQEPPKPNVECGNVCSQTPVPYPNADCYEVRHDDGTCAPVFINSIIGNLANQDDSNNIVTGPYKTDNTSLVSDGGDLPRIIKRYDTGADHLLAKRLHWEQQPKPQLICGQFSHTCFDRLRGANLEHCKDLMNLVANRHGYWLISKQDLIGRHWLTLMESRSCMFAVGHPLAEQMDGETRLGNHDIEIILSGTIGDCLTSIDIVEAQGTNECKPWGIFYWLTRKDKFNCCQGDKPGELSKVTM